MALKDTYHGLRELLSHITIDLAKAEGGNKAASQRVRTGTVKLEKIAKQYRKESIQSEKGGSGAKTKAKSHAKAKPAVKKPVAKAKPSALSSKHSSAKLPSRR